MTSTLTMAKTQLFARPAEEHFESFAALRENAAAQRKRCREIEARDLNILFSEDGSSVYFGDHSTRATAYSYAQLAAVARVPLHVLERLEAPTRSSVMNQCYERSRRFRVGLCDGDSLRAVTSDRYERVWDEELYEAVDRWLIPSGFIPAVPTDGGANVKNDRPALFRSDRDSFAFFYSERPPHDPYGGLRKGVVVFNSEVGAKCLGYATFLFRSVCANFMIWGVGEYRERTARHVSTVREVFASFDQELRRISNEVTPEEMKLIERAAATDFTPGRDAEDAQDRLFEEFKVPRKVAAVVVEAALYPENPGDLTVWGVANGLTSVAHEMPYAEERVELARVAGEILAAR